MSTRENEPKNPNKRDEERTQQEKNQPGRQGAPSSKPQDPSKQNDPRSNPERK